MSLSISLTIETDQFETASSMKAFFSPYSSNYEHFSDFSNEKSPTTEFSHLVKIQELTSNTLPHQIETENIVYDNFLSEMSPHIQGNSFFGEKQFDEVDEQSKDSLITLSQQDYHQNYQNNIQKCFLSEDSTNQFIHQNFQQQQQSYYSDPLILKPSEIDSEEQPNQNEEIYFSIPSFELEIKPYTNPLPEAPETINNPESKAVSQIVKKKRSDVKDLVRHRRRITERRLPHSETTVKVQEKTEEKKKQFKNNFKNFLKKAIPFLISKLMECNPKDCKLMECNPKDGDYDQMLLILESFLNKTSKDHILFLVKNVTLLEDSEFYHLSKVNRDRHKRTFLKEQKSNPDFRMLLFIKSHMQQPDSYEEYQHIVYVINKLNSFNRKYLLRFTMNDYIPIILNTKADKQDQFYTNNYIRYVLTNTSIIE